MNETSSPALKETTAEVTTDGAGAEDCDAHAIRGLEVLGAWGLVGLGLAGADVKV